MDEATRALLALAQSMLGDLDIEAVLERVLAAAREVTGARYAALGVLDETRSELASFHALGIDPAEQPRIGSLPRGRGVLGELIRHPVPLRQRAVAEHPRSYGFPDGHPAMRGFLGVPILVNGLPYGNLYLTDPEAGETFSAADEEAVVALAEFAAIAIDHARQLAGSEAERASLQLTVDGLDATMRISRALGGHTDPAAILDLVSERGRALVEADAFIIETEHDGELEIAAATGELPEGLVGRRLPLAGTVADTALAARRTQRLDGRNRERFERSGLGALGVRAGDGLVVPMIFGNQGFGVLVALEADDGEPFSAAHQELLESFAASAASALATARSATLERRRQSLAAAEAERTRWARELHDETLQSLAHLRLLLASAHRRGGEESMGAGIRQALAQLDLDIAALRALIADLRPAALDELGVEAAVRALAERLGRSGVQVDLSVELAPDPRHLDEVDVAVYRIVQEALTNAVKHGKAAHAIVEITERDDSITLSISDDGTGFTPGAPTRGFGLLGMRERVELLSGTLSVSSAPGGPTTVTARLPTALDP